eukprot:COSAG01_NODE_1073_length_11862_cov_11.086117_10_plen_162_part_00
MRAGSSASLTPVPSHRAADNKLLPMQMLGDHGDWNKEKPWEGSAHVPLVCGGPRVRQQVVSQPVTTMDLAATWLDLAGVSGMGRMVDSTSRSLLPVLRGDMPQNREFISSGLGQNASGLPLNLTWDWRMVVKRAVFSPAEAAATTLKYHLRNIIIQTGILN